MGSYLSTQEINEDIDLYREISNEVEKPKEKSLDEHIIQTTTSNLEDLELENKMLKKSLEKYKSLYYNSLE
jgi:hypothetical protein